MVGGNAGTVVDGPAEHVRLRVGPDLERSVRLRELNENVVEVRPGPHGARGPAALSSSESWSCSPPTLRQHDAGVLVSIAMDGLTTIGVVALVGVTVGVVVSVWQRRRASTPDGDGYSRRVVWVDPLAVAADIAGVERFATADRTPAGNVTVTLAATRDGIDLVPWVGLPDRLTVPWANVTSIQIVTARTSKERGTIIGLRSGRDLWFRRGGGHHLLPALHLAGARDSDA